MYYSSALPPTKPKTAFDAGHALREFDFLALRDARHLALFRPLVEACQEAGGAPLPRSKNPAIAMHVDLVSSCLGHMAHRGYLQPSILREANEFFHRTVVQHGYRLILPPFTEIRGGTDAAVEVIVPGAQTGRIFQARIDACIRMLRELSPAEVNITFTGGNPGHDSAQIPNEAEDMAQYFHERVKRIPGNWRIHLESRANNTRQNLERTAEQWAIRHQGNRGLRAASETTSIHCFVVSSLFHLPRLVQEATEVFDGKNVSRLTFVSSQESLSEVERTVRHERARYVKSCLYEFYMLLLAEAMMDEGKKRGHDFGPTVASPHKWEITVKKVEPGVAPIKVAKG